MKSHFSLIIYPERERESHPSIKSERRRRLEGVGESKEITLPALNKYSAYSTHSKILFIRTHYNAESSENNSLQSNLI